MDQVLRRQWFSLSPVERMSAEICEDVTSSPAMYHDVEISEQQIAAGQVKDARMALRETRGKYGL